MRHEIPCIPSQNVSSSVAGTELTESMAYKPIDWYGLIGDMNSAALVGTDGSIDWCCFPRFDSPSVFAAILDDREGGRFQIGPSDAPVSVTQSYLANTNILSTRFETQSGEIRLIDFMPVGDEPVRGSHHEIHRIVRCTSGTVEVRCIFQPRVEYARVATSFTRRGEAIIARGGHQLLTLCSNVPMEVGAAGASGLFTLTKGEEAVFVLSYGHGRAHRVESYHTSRKLDHTRAYWEGIAADIIYSGEWRKDVVRSFLMLHLLHYEPTGGIVAAPTTSLPEGIGGSRNWDYRYAWLRDSSFTMDVLCRMGHTERATKYLRWLLHQCKVTNGRARIVYGVSSSSSLKEVRLDHLDGYKGSRPVRIGNGAARHLQLDVFGDVILGIYTLHRDGGVVTDDAWSLVENFADVVSRNWHRRDRSVWEVRGAQQHFVYSKIMCWVALDRASALADALGRNGQADHWRQVAAIIKDEVLERGWSDRKQAFVQRYDSDTLDASNLVIPFVGFLPPNDTRVLSNLDAVMRELADGPFVRRYNPHETDDGLEGEEEGSFTILSFWLIGNLIYTGQLEKARAYFEQILGNANHLGLFAEMINPRTKQFVGNFPQAYSHVGLIHTARNLSRATAGGQLGYAQHEAAAN